MKLSGCLFVVLLLLVSGCGPKQVKDVPDFEPDQKDISDITDEALLWADSVCATMTLSQKVAQLHLPAIYAAADTWTMKLVREYADSCIGGVVLLKGDARGAAAIADSLRNYGRVPPFVAIDAEWGLAMRLADAPRFPPNSAIDENTDDQLMYEYGRELARECRLLGINMVLGPVIDVSSPGSFMSRRSFGDDPRRVADLGVAYARGLEDGDVISVAKHFPGHGSVSDDSHKRKGVIERSLHVMDSIDLYPFRHWVNMHLSGIMVGHLAVPSIDSEMRPAAVSRTVITDLLRDDLGYSGLVMTDALNMKGAEGYGSADAIAAGADIVIAPLHTFDEVAAVCRAVESGVLSEETIDEHVRRVLFYKYLTGAYVRDAGGDGDEFLPGNTYDISLLRSPEADSISVRLRHRKK